RVGIADILVSHYPKSHKSRPTIVMAGGGRPSTAFLAASSQDVDDRPQPSLGAGPSPVMTARRGRRVNSFGAWYYQPCGAAGQERILAQSPSALARTTMGEN